MDKDNISRIINEELAAAKEWAAKQNKSIRKRDIAAYVIAVVVAVVAYFLLQRYQPGMVLKVVDGVQVFDKTRAAVLAVIAGLTVLLGHAML